MFCFADSGEIAQLSFELSALSFEQSIIRFFTTFTHTLSNSRTHILYELPPIPPTPPDIPPPTL